MTTLLKTASVAIALGLAAVAPAYAGAYDQLAASAGLSRDEAAGLTLPQIAGYLANRGVSGQDWMTVPGAIDMRADVYRMSDISTRNEPGLSLRELAAIHANRGVSAADQINVMSPVPGMAGDRAQLAASAGLGVEGAEGRSLSELAGRLANRGVSNADAMTVRK